MDYRPTNKLDSAHAARLLYDGDCGFCAYWVRYWARLTGDKIEYRPYQEVITEHPELDEARCRNAVQFRRRHGDWVSGAEATYAVLALGGYPMLAKLYARLTAFARLSEASYAAIANRRDIAFSLARCLWGSERHPARYTAAASIFLRLLGLIYCAAFVSLAVQITGLVGQQGILPAQDFLNAVQQALGNSAWYKLPNLFWFNASDLALQLACAAGTLLGLVIASGRFQTTALAFAYVLYLSLFAIGQDFMRFQWDLLLLEAGFLALLLPARPALGAWLFRVLLFRFMFLSGAVKLLSGDPSWARLRALDYHYFTQPLPTPLAWYAALLPGWFDTICVVGTFVVELALPFLIFAPRHPRMLAAIGILLFETTIMLSGNYNFFNILTMAFCLFLFDDAQLTRFARRSSTQTKRRFIPTALVSFLAATLLVHHAYFLLRPFVTPPALAQRLVSTLAPLRIASGYGLFAVMTTTRPEIEIEGSTDGRHWQAYQFRYKPGDPAHGLRWNIPHQPRLDWQMWFAALANADQSPWFARFLACLLRDQTAVTRLLSHNPFPDAPPKFVRAVRYDYRYTLRAERQSSGNVWSRKVDGLFYPSVSLR